MHDDLLGNRPVLTHSQSSRSELLDVRTDRPPQSPELPRRRPPRSCRSFRDVSALADRYLRNECRQSLLRQSSRTCPPGSQSCRIQSARRQYSHLFKAFRFLRSLSTRKGHLRRRSPPLHVRIRQTQPRRKTHLISQVEIWCSDQFLNWSLLASCWFFQTLAITYLCDRRHSLLFCSALQMEPEGGQP